jgi:type I restriction enzyme, S subunit
MSSEWPTVSIEDVCDLIVDCVNKTAPVVAQETPFRMIRTTNVRHGRIDLSECRYVEEDTYEKWTRRANLQPGDVILTREAPIGEVGMVKDAEGVFLGQRLMQYRANPKLLDSRFLLYTFLSPALQHQFGSHEGSGSVVSHIRVGDCFKFKLSLPPIGTQREIAATLGALDDRITRLRETNATLEAIAQALFKSWFVDFDPVRAKMTGRAPEGMDEATAALFPDALEETALGLVPKGWRVSRVGDVAEVVKGKSYSSKDLVVSHHSALVTLKSFERGGGFRMDGFKPYVGTYKPTQVVRAGDLIVAYTDVTQAAELIGKPAIVVGVDAFDTLVASLDVGIVRPVPARSSKLFLYGLFNTDAFQAHTLAHTSGTTVLHLAKDGIGSFLFPCPPMELIESFEDLVSALMTRKQVNSDSISTLSELRDTLLPRLISGQLRLPDAQHQMGEAIGNT